MASFASTPLRHRPLLPAFATTLALLSGLAAQPARADDYIVDASIGDAAQCTSLTRNTVTFRSPSSGSSVQKIVWRTGETALDIGGGVTSFSAWGNFDLATRVTLTGIPGAELRVQDRKGGPGNAARGCGATGSLNLQIFVPGQNATVQRGRLRFEFPIGNPFEIPVLVQPVPVGLDLRWPSQTRNGTVEGQHAECLRANGGHVKVQGDLMEIGLNPEGPLPQNCDLFSLEAFSIRDLRDIKSSVVFGGSGNDRNVSVTRVTGLAAGQTFAQGHTDRLHGMSALVRDPNPAPSAPFAALKLDYAALARALNPTVAGSAQMIARPSAGTLPAVTRLGTAPVPTQATAPPAPRSFEFQLALDSFNNVAGLHGPMRVRVVETRAAVTSNLVASLDLDPICNDLNTVDARDTSTSGLAITRREIRSSDGQTFSNAGGPLRQRIGFRSPGTYTVTLTVTDASGAVRTTEQRIGIPRPACVQSSPGGSTVRIGGGGGEPNLLPARAFPERPLLRRIGGLGDKVMLPITFCSGLGNNERREVAVPDLAWGVSSAGAASPSVRVELRDALTQAVLSQFESGPISANSAPVTRSNYTGRPARVRVVNVTGDDTMVAYGNQAGCFLDKDVAAPRLDPDFRLLVDTQDAVAEGESGRELDNELAF